jgi:hypothetical protein
MGRPLATGIDSRFLQVPGLLIVRLMRRCNQKCVFCMVEEEIKSSDDIDYEEAADQIRSQPTGSHIELFGGEPTLYPGFLDLLRLACSTGHRCSIATNGRIFANRDFLTKVVALGPSRIYIRTSLYGDCSELHDYYTGCPGSYDQTVQGIRNIVAAGFPCQVNVVILAKNVDLLSAMVKLIHSFGVPRIKFGNLVEVAACVRHAVPLSVVRPRLGEAVALAEGLGLTVTIEKTPICAAFGRIDLMSTERLVGRWLRCFDDLGACKGCLVRRWCEGVDPDYVTVFGYEGLQCLHDVPRAAVPGTVSSGLEPEFLKNCCVEIPDGDPDESTLLALASLHRRVETQLGQLVAFPRRFIRS